MGHNAEKLSSASGVVYRPVLPPVANYLFKNFFLGKYVSRLMADVREYLVALTISAEESLCCLLPDLFVLFSKLIVGYRGKTTQGEMLNAYHRCGNCLSKSPSVILILQAETN